jgi:predicted NACHT family NTPase
MKENNYEQRFIRNSINNIEFSIFEDENKKTLSDLLFENDKIVLLGNPGVGKTIELKELFEKLWKNKDESINFPFFINIKNFRKTSKFEDLIPYENWKDYSSSLQEYVKDIIDNKKYTISVKLSEWL